jgi:hypothetical protein
MTSIYMPMYQLPRTQCDPLAYHVQRNTQSNASPTPVICHHGAAPPVQAYLTLGPLKYTGGGGGSFLPHLLLLLIGGGRGMLSAQTPPSGGAGVYLIGSGARPHPGGGRIGILLARPLRLKQLIIQHNSARTIRPPMPAASPMTSVLFWSIQLIISPPTVDP